ncbi:MAG: dTDP-4-dehydrorhamnose 3,5-epimerase [Pseudomonadota bacterium]|nr:dTDP-4-dehydrorhamnose 3,5-epimerase [Pseudomonadota bacterium]
MKFTETRLPGAYVVEPEPLVDERGFFARAWCSSEFEKNGLVNRSVQANMSSTRKKGTMRGLHHQVPPHAETKFFRCTRGSLFDVIVDLRKDSPTFRQWTGLELSAENHVAIYVPEGFAHGYLTLEDETDAYYQVSEFYTPGAERGFRYDDPAFGIDWPIEPRVVSDKDLSWEPFGC